MTDMAGLDGFAAAGEPVWRVVFCDPEPLDAETCGRCARLFDAALRLLAPGCRHCFLMRRLAGAGRRWRIVKPHSARLDIFELREEGDDDPMAEARGYAAYIDRLARSGAVRCRDIPQAYPSSIALRPWFSCVEVVKHATGIKPPFWVVTPRQLYRWLGAPGPACKRPTV